MKLTEGEGKELLRAYGIETPAYAFIDKEMRTCPLVFPCVLKSQVPASDRKTKGGVLVVRSEKEFAVAARDLFSRAIDGLYPKRLLAEEYVESAEELYASFSYASDLRGPALSLNKRGGTGVRSAFVFPVDIISGFNFLCAAEALTEAGIVKNESLIRAICALWQLFSDEKLALAEINPLFVLSNGRVVAGDAKVERDDALLPLKEKELISLGGDIAIIASGGGASMLNIDILMRAGGKPANYTEYSGNPPASIVEELTVKILSQPRLRGAWVIGGTANFTDIYETMRGFADGLRRVRPKPTYPIVIRRDGPRQAEAKEMLLRTASEEAFPLTVFGNDVSMAESAARLLRDLKQHESSP
jgi:succinyl-CoA synthetase beta subunit